jgi:hypothetical protein
LKDSTGTVLETSSGNYPYVLPGETVYLSTQESTDAEVASVDFSIKSARFVDAKLFETRYAPTSVTSKKLGVSPGEVIKVSDVRYHGWGTGDGADILGSFTSSAKVPVSDVVISCALFKGGKVIGGSYDVYDANVPPKKPVGFAAGLRVDGLSPDEVRCGSLLNSGSEAIVGDLTKLVVSETALSADTAHADDYGVAAAIRNGTKQTTSSVNVEFDVLDKAGRIIGHVDDLAGYIFAGETAYEGDDSVPGYHFDGTPASVRAMVGGDTIADSEFQERYGLPVNQAKFTFSNLNYQVGRFGDDLIGTVAAVNTPMQVEVEAHCGVYKDGKLSGSGFDFVDIPAGQPANFEASTTTGAGPGEVRCNANVSSVTSTTPTTTAP